MSTFKGSKKKPNVDDSSYEPLSKWRLRRLLRAHGLGRRVLDSGFLDSRFRVDDISWQSCEH